MIAEVSARIEAKFLSTPSARRATLTSFFSFFDLLLISIHALREEGDGILGVLNPHKYISIHALREEGDAARCCCAAAQQHFYPRPPRGGRLMVTLLLAVVNEISIHALREEGDRYFSPMPFDMILFLSTPSARRATAKTERKPSAFVSLYTSLHKLQRGACKTNRKITPLLAQTAGIPVRSVWENHVRCLFALAGHQKISTLSCANSGCSPTCSTLVW